MSIFSRDMHQLDPSAVQWRLHVTPQRRRKVGEVTLFQVPGPLNQERSSHLCQRIDHWAFDLLDPRPPLSLDACIEEIAEGIMQRRLPGIG